MTIFGDRVSITDIAGNVLMDFNGEPTEASRWWCDQMEGWDNTSDLDISLVSYGLADGAIAATRFPGKERYITIGGACQAASRQVAEEEMNRLVNVFRQGIDVCLVRAETVAERRMVVRLASSIEFPQRFEQEFRWMMTLVALRPYKESTYETEAITNVFAGELIARTYEGGQAGDTNWHPNPSFETNVSTGVFTPAGSTITRVSTSPASGSWCAQVTTTATAQAGIILATLDRAPNSYELGDWSGSVSLRGNAGGETVNTWIRALYDDGTQDDSAPVTRTLTTSWQTFSMSVEAAGLTNASLRKIEIHARIPTAVAKTFFVDRPHISKSAIATTSFTGTSYPDNSFHTGAANVSPVSRQSEPKSPPRRTYGDSYARSYSSSQGASEYSVIDLVGVNNEGNTISFPITTITGPLLGGTWEIRNDTTGDRLNFRVDIQEGVDLVIDHGAQTALLNGQPVEYRKDGKWWGLAPGYNQLRLVADTFDVVPTAKFTYRSAWRN